MIGAHITAKSAASAIFRGCDFSGAVLTGWEITDQLSFQHCDFTGARFIRCAIASLHFTQCDLRASTLIDCDIGRVSMQWCETAGFTAPASRIATISGIRTDLEGAANPGLWQAAESAPGKL